MLTPVKDLQGLASYGTDLAYASLLPGTSYSLSQSSREPLKQIMGGGLVGALSLGMFVPAQIGSASTGHNTNYSQAGSLSPESSANTTMSNGYFDNLQHSDSNDQESVASSVTGQAGKSSSAQSSGRKDRKRNNTGGARNRMPKEDLWLKPIYGKRSTIRGMIAFPFKKVTYFRRHTTREYLAKFLASQNLPQTNQAPEAYLAAAGPGFSHRFETYRDDEEDRRKRKEGKCQLYGWRKADREGAKAKRNAKNRIRVKNGLAKLPHPGEEHEDSLDGI